MLKNINFHRQPAYLIASVINTTDSEILRKLPLMEKSNIFYQWSSNDDGKYSNISEMQQNNSGYNPLIQHKTMILKSNSNK